MTYRSVPLILTLGVLIYATVLVAFSSEGAPQSVSDVHRFPWLIDKPLGEDGFYLLRTARNIAHGEGVVYSPGEPTTGIQPLATFIYAGMYWGCERLGLTAWTFLRSVILFNVLCLLLVGHLIGKTFDDIYQGESPQFRRLGYALCFGLIVLNGSLFRIFTYGLETGTYLVLLAATLRLTVGLKQSGPRLRRLVAVSILAGITAWARIDFGVVFAMFVFISLIRRLLSLREAVLCGGTSAAILSPWFMYIHAVSGKWFPSSGSAESGVIDMSSAPSRIKSMIIAFSGAVAPWGYAGAGLGIAIGALCILIVLLAYAWFAAPARGRAIAKVEQAGILMNWLVAAAVLIPVYLVFFYAEYFYARYLTPLALPGALLFAILMAERLRDARPAAGLGLVGGLSACFAISLYAGLHTSRIGDLHSVSAGFIARNFPHEKVGCWQSGVIGYLNDNVVNLDGKVNAGALAARHSCTLPEFLDRQQINVLVDWSDNIAVELPADYLARSWQRSPLDVGNDRSVCYVRRTAVTSP